MSRRLPFVLVLLSVAGPVLAQTTAPAWPPARPSARPSAPAPTTWSTATPPGAGLPQIVAPAAPAYGSVSRPAAAPAPAAQPAASAPPGLETFDPTTAQLVWQDRRWLLKAGGKTLKDFGPRQAEARRALALVRDLHLNQHGTVGGPEPILEYWLADGKAPQGFISGVRTMPLDPAALSVAAVQGQWCVRDGQRILFNFGRQEADARQALGVMQQYGFNQVALVGQGTPSMLVFLAQANGPASRIHQVSHREAPPAPADMMTRFPGAANSPFVTPALPPLRNPRPDPGPRTPFGQNQARAFSPTRARPVSGAAPIRSADGLSAHVPFDWRRVELLQDNGEWKLTAGRTELARFGADEYAARQALSAMHYYRFNEQQRLGDGPKAFAYFLPGFQSPRNVMFGLPSQPILPDRVEARQVGGEWVLYAGGQVLLPLGDRPEIARHLADLIRRERYDRLCHVGQPGTEGLTFLVRSR